MIISSAPGRAGIVGNPSDMYGGSVISCTVPHRASCRVTPAAGLAIEVDGERCEIRSRADFALRKDRLDAAKAVMSSFEVDPSKFRFSFTVTSDIPEQAGLAGSTAMVVALVGAVVQLLDLPLSPYEIAETARKIEAEVMGVVCGFQDQYMAVFGGLNYMDFRDKQDLKQTKDEPFATIEPLAAYVSEMPIILAHTGIKRESGRVHKSIRQRWEQGEPAVVQGYERIAELARLAKKSLLAGKWDELAELMNENHAIQRDLGGSGPVNEMLIKVALENGALGAKLAGAGHGGTIIVLTLDKDRTARALEDAGADRILRIQPVEGLTVERSW